jgi:ectoine hydroxylase-related dioxygenase (phytanoyl-CoA dioxygenase family)
VLDDQAVSMWRETGAAVVSDLFPKDLITAVHDGVITRFPEPDSEAAREIRSFGGRLNFPDRLSAFNELTLHPRLLQAVAELLMVPISELRLTQSDLWPKYGKSDDPQGPLDIADQRIHVDYPNHTLVHPPPWDRPEAVEMIVYFSDVDVCGGPTAVVPREGQDDELYPWPIVDTPGVGELVYINDRQSAEAYMREHRPAAAQMRDALYDRECYVRFRPGTVLLYRHDVWHRGTPMIPDTLRIVQNLTFKRADSEWISTLHTGWAWSAYRPDKFFERLLAYASLDQRAVLGFPQPGNRYWCEATIEAVEARHGCFGMDMTPYRDALAE